MALQGTIKDFSLSDIFQLIGIQRKTGILTLENDEDTVTVHFLEGQVVGANTRLRNLEDLLGGVLVQTGRIREAQLQEALRIQKKTLQRLGFILVKCEFISEVDLKEALRVQVNQIVYRLFRWRDGRYRFAAVEHLEYDREHFVPVNAETILMEGARMIDEWPIIERKIRSAQMVFQKTPAAASLEAPFESLVDTDIDFGPEEGGTAPDTQDEGELRTSPDEVEILRLVDGQATVQEVVNRSPIGEFDVYRILYELLNHHLIEEIAASPSPEAGPAGEKISRLLNLLVPVVLLAASLLSVLTLARNPLTPWKMALEGEERARLGTYASRARLELLERSLQVFYLDLASVPDKLERLAQHGYLRQEDLRDPWGQAYQYELAPGGYQLSGRDAEGRTSKQLTFSRRFSSSQRMILQGTPGGASQDSSPHP